MAFEGNMFFKQGMEHNGGGSRILHSLYVVQTITQRRG
jgi:hypothetical protein